MRRADAGETIDDTIDFSQTPNASDYPASDHGSGEHDLWEQRIEVLAEMICRPGDEPETKSAALAVLMATLEQAKHHKVFANTAKHFAFTCCGELNLHGMVDAQIAVLEDGLFVN